MARANQRSCTRCHRDLPTCSCGGVGPARRSARLCRGRDPGGADRISALPDDLLLQILNRLGCAAAAARTGLLSRRWRGLWTRLPDLVLREMNPGSLHAALARLVAAFELEPRARPRLLNIRAPSYRMFSPAQIASLLNAAAMLQPENLTIAVAAAVLVMLPSLDGTRSMTLDVQGVSLITPQFGDMPDLESLSLHRYDAVPFSLLRRCSALRSLSISYWRLDSITIDLPLLEELVLSATAQLRRVVIKAPRLKKLTFGAIEGVLDDFSLCYMASEVEHLSWQCASGASHVHFGDIWSLMTVTMKTSEPQGQLQRCPTSNTLSLNIFEWQFDQEEGAALSFDFEHYISSCCPIANISALELCINSSGHVYGVLVLHLLEVYTLIKRLKVDLCKFQVPLQLILMEPKQPEAI
ncbi:putative F-box/FBD/LRR-repeat protein At3g49030 isoform X4 [Panicum virgatum]|uniref:putative F-box/FBD/LRR-repeat protein At3g49030 isoform X4 n=1 Tax=Panicum virgatum TaxID=38727 RepID=UPI0019D649EC|nr:putative F-box/FBD/LRR-repeat protein At3g49030 isoform X4 [Panicum virgatum]